MPFQDFKIDHKIYQVILPNKAYEPKHREQLSKALLDKFGRNITPEDTIQALIFCYDYFTEEFSKLIGSINDLMFYFFVFNLHEQTAELSYKRSVEGIAIPVEGAYFAQYRRILKLILQESCFVEIKENTLPTPKWMEQSLAYIEELIFLGSFAYDMVNSISEQKFTGGSIQIVFVNNLYVFQNMPEWDGFLHLFHNDFERQVDGSIHDESLQQKFDSVLTNEFNIDLMELSIIIESVSERLYNQVPPRICMVSELIALFKKESESSYIEPFILGLTLNKRNVAKLKLGIYASYNGDRLIHRPFLSIDIEDTPCVLFGKYTFLEAVNTLFQNQITHGKLPEEWKKIPFIKSVQKELVQYHKDVLENPVEKALIDKKVLHDRNVKTLKAVNHFENHSINDEPGEIDFIFVLGKKIYLADCKNLTKRYEMRGCYQDLNKFEPYNKKMNEKVSFMLANLDKLERHLRIISGSESLDIFEMTIEGIFIVNTPTLYAVNAPFKVYSFYNFKRLLEGEDLYQGVIVVPDGQDTEIHWPYIDNYNRYLGNKN